MLRNLLVFPIIVMAFAGCQKSRKKNAPPPVLNESIKPAGFESFTQCHTTNRTLLWAQYAVDADLMQQFSADRNLDMTNEKVAVVDSGFDGSLRKFFPGRVDALLATDQSVAPEADISRHGTFVSALIGAGTYGMAPGVSLAVYKLGAADGSYPYKEVYSGALKACREGYKLINVSQGHWIYEFDVAKEMKDFAPELTEMAERGCLLIKAAGNVAASGRRATMDLNDMVLHVEGASVSRSLSKFSNDGEVRAPGSLVASLKESDASLLTCEGTQYPGGVANGTSFAAPIVTGILAHVRAHLNAASDYQNLAPALQIQLLNNIMKASELEGLVNGYRAVMIASHWKKEAMKVENLTALLDPLCPAAETLPSCGGNLDLNDYLECSKPLRRRLALCAQTAEPAVTTPFLHSLARHKAGDLWLNYARVVQQPGVLRASAATARDVFQQSMPGHRHIDENSSWLEGLDLLAATDLLMKGAALSQDYLEQFFRSSALLEALSRSPGRDGQLSQKLPEVLERIKNAQGNLLVPAFSGAYQSWEDYMLALGKPSKSQARVIDTSGRIRLFNLMQAAAASDEDKLTITQLEDSFVSLMRQSAVDFPRALAGPYPSLNFLMDEPRETAWDGELLFDFYQRKGLDSDAIIREQQWKTVPTSYVMGLLAHEKKSIIAAQTYPSQSMAILRALSQEPLWNRDYNIHQVLRAAIFNLEIAYQKSPDQLERMQDELQSIFDGAISSGFKFSWLESHHFLLGNRYSTFEDGSTKAIPISNFLTPAIRLNFLLEILAEMPVQKPEAIMSYSYDIGRMFYVNADLLPLQGWETIQAPASWKFGNWHDANAGRFDQIKLEEHTFTNSAGITLPYILGRGMAAYLDALSHDIHTFDGYRPLIQLSMLRTLQRLNRFCELVDKTHLRPAVTKLESTIDTAPNGKFYQHLKKDLTDFQQQCLGTDG